MTNQDFNIRLVDVNNEKNNGFLAGVSLPPPSRAPRVSLAPKTPFPFPFKRLPRRLGIDKGLIKNKKLLSDLIEKEKGYRNVENTCDNESNNEESSSDIENQEEEEEVASENGVEAEGTQESDNDTENDIQETESSSSETSTAFHSKSPCEHCENSNVYWTLITKCRNCFWHDYYKICPICDHQITEGRNYMKEGFRRCHDCGAVTHKNAKTLETNFYSASK